MDDEREIDLIHIPDNNSKEDGDASFAVAALGIHAASLEQGGNRGNRLLIITLDNERLFSLTLETPNDPTHHSPPRGKPSGFCPQGLACLLVYFIETDGLLPRQVETGPHLCHQLHLHPTVNLGEVPMNLQTDLQPLLLLLLQ